MEYGIWNYIFEIFILLLSCYFIMHELLQMKGISGGIFVYLFDLTNLLELLSSGMNIFLIFNEWTSRKLTDTKWLRLCTVVAIGLVWYKAFYFMRLFEKHAFFMNLLKQTLQDIVSFMLMLVILIGAASNMIYVIMMVDHNIALLEDDEMPPIIT